MHRRACRRACRRRPGGRTESATAKEAEAKAGEAIAIEAGKRAEAEAEETETIETCARWIEADLIAAVRIAAALPPLPLAACS